MKNNKWFIIITAAVVLIACCVAGYLLIIKPQADYQHAVDLYEQGEYAAAKECFTKLGSYNNSREFVKNCSDWLNYNEMLSNYEQANAYYAQENYADALEYYRAAGDFMDSNERASECEEFIINKERLLSYASANDYFNEGNYEQALTLYLSLGDYLDCEELAVKAQAAIKETDFEFKYNEALELAKEGDYEGAIAILMELENYNDSFELITSYQNTLNFDELFGASVGNIVNLGCNSKYNFNSDKEYNYSPLKWIVAAKEGTKMLLVAEQPLTHCRRFHSERTGVTWADCDLRTWLNTEFLEDCFSEEEFSVIAETKISTPENPYARDKMQVPDTIDRVFILSFDEHAKYNISMLGDRYRYWLRDPGYAKGFASKTTNLDGSYEVDYTSVYVRPAMWVDIQK